MTFSKESLRRALESLGYSLHRWPANRFDGMRDALLLLRRSGYAPRVVIDCGASMGAWTRMARLVFPHASFHLIEPQPACRGALEALVGSTTGLSFHPVALTKVGVDRVRLIGGGERGGGTGAWVARPDERASDEVECPATTLDSLFVDRVTPRDRALLKLDLEGHELAALDGGGRVLQAVEVVLTEVQFLEVDRASETLLCDVVRALRERGFDLYDVACLSGRPRDARLRMGDIIFARRDSTLVEDRAWE